MSAICGIFNTDSTGGVQQETIRKMCFVVSCRGRDDSGIYMGHAENGKNNIGLGINLFSAMDTKTGHQPIHNEDGTIWIVCDGEIYNFRELRRELENGGHHFYTGSDVETIVHLYEAHGIDCLKYLRGIFAFALWDERKKKLFLARDRVGQKPLCCTQNGKQLIFASEIKSILQVPGISREVNPEAIHHYLTYKYVPAPLTAFKNIKKLLPAHYLLYEKGKISIHQYWNLNRFFAPLGMTGRVSGMTGSKSGMTEDEYCECIRELLEESTRIRLAGDVETGAFLSGGIDSSIIVGLMTKIMKRPVKTFSIGFEEKAYNELHYARIAAQHFRTDHHEHVIKADVLEILPELIWHYEEPFADSSSVATYYAAKTARQEIKIALNGDGGDENFAGYSRYKAIRLAEYYDKLPYWVRRGVIANIVKRIPYSPKRRCFVRQFKKLMESMDYPKEERYLRWICTFDKERKAMLYTPSFREAVSASDSLTYLQKYYNASGCKNFLDSTLFVDIMTYVPGDYLVKMDIAAMANSLGARSPFLDHKFMEFAASIPSNLKLKGFNNTKYILKKAFSDLLPHPILHRKKMGFGVPIANWLRNGLRDYARDILLSRRSLERGYFRKEYLESLLDEHIRGRYDHGDRLWALLNLELWHRMFIDRIPDGKLYGDSSSFRFSE